MKAFLKLIHTDNMDNCHCDYNHYNSHGDVLCIFLIANGIYEKYQKYKMRKNIKKYLKIVVEYSNIIQDEKNILKDMKNANFPQQDINNQFFYVGRLILKQQGAIHDLQMVESQYPGEIHNRFFYLNDKSIF